MDSKNKPQTIFVLTEYINGEIGDIHSTPHEDILKRIIGHFLKEHGFASEEDYRNAPTERTINCYFIIEKHILRTDRKKDFPSASTIEIGLLRETVPNVINSDGQLEKIAYDHLVDEKEIINNNHFPFSMPQPPKYKKSIQKTLL